MQISIKIFNNIELSLLFLLIFTFYFSDFLEKNSINFSATVCPITFKWMLTFSAFLCYASHGSSFPPNFLDIDYAVLISSICFKNSFLFHFLFFISYLFFSVNIRALLYVLPVKCPYFIMIFVAMRDIRQGSRSLHSVIVIHFLPLVLL